MQNYKDTNGNVHALSDTDIANGGLGYLPDGCVEITQEEATFIANPLPSVADLWRDYQSKAKDQLADNDIVAIRCVKACVAYPAEWLACDVALRDIVHASGGDPTLPLPAYPITRPIGT